MTARDPWEALRRLGPRSSVLGLVPWLAMALLSHTGAYASDEMSLRHMRGAVRTMHAELASYFALTVDVDVVEPDPTEDDAKTAEPEPEPEPEVKPEPDPAPRPVTPPPPSDKPEPKDAASKEPYGDAAPPAAAEAGDALTKDDGDLTSWTMVDKNGSKVTGGGYTSAEGTAKHAVSDPRASGKGREGARGTQGDAEPGAKRVDKSRPPMPMSRNLSDCPFPPQADVQQVDRAVVDVTVSVDANGRPTGAVVSADPGFGFGTQARRCALSMRYEPAHGPDGEPVPGTTPTLRFRFNR